MKKVNIFLMSILAICSAFVMMNPKSYQSSYALENESVNSFVSPLIINNYINGEFEKTWSMQQDQDVMNYTTAWYNFSGLTRKYSEYAYFYQFKLERDTNLYISFPTAKYYDTLIAVNNDTQVWSNANYFDVEHVLSTPSFDYYMDDTGGASNIAGNSTRYLLNSNCHIFGLNSSAVPIWVTEDTTNAFALFNCNVATLYVTSVALSQVSVPTRITFDSTTGLNCIINTLTDSDGNKITFYTISVDTVPTYTYTGNIGSDTSEYNSGFNDGQRVGYDNGYNTGYNDGYDTGYSYGESIGDAAGFSRGVASANDYTFIGLIGSVIDAPIAAFRGLLSFEVFGVDLAPFMLGLFSIALVLIIIRKMRGV